MTNKVKVKNPHGIVVIYNYRERFGDNYIANSEFEIEQVILNSASLLSIQTQKSKGSPNGAFEIKLAPYKNWTSAITPGSWCVILMSNSAVDDGAKYGGTTVNSKSFKMLGRIESVRGVVSTNKMDGSVTKHYIVTGSDWGTVFNNSLYVDPLDRDPNATALGMAQRYGYGDYVSQVLNWKSSTTKNDPNNKDSSKTRPDTKDDQVKESLDDMTYNEAKIKESQTKSLTEAKKTAGELTAAASDPRLKVKSEKGFGPPTSIFNIRILLNLWGNTSDREGRFSVSMTNNLSNGMLLGDAQQKFRLPDQLCKYMNFTDDGGKVINSLSELIDCTSYSGRLTGYDKYSGLDISTDIGLIHFDTIFGENSMWQVLTQNFNSLTSELIPEVRFDSESGKPTLALYNRIKPFAIRNADRILKDSYEIAMGSKETILKPDQIKKVVDDNLSLFKDVRCKTIDYNDVILSSFGTNWRDKINFIEVSIDRSMFMGETFSAAIKLDSQFFDKKSIARDGLRSMRESTQYVPILQEFANPTSVFAYKYLLKEWFFDTHTMLNGTLNLVGQDDYIQVGDNIMVNAKVLDINRNFSKSQNDSGSAVYLLAQVESIAHNMMYEENVRAFTTTINFVRGILVNSDRTTINEANNGSDQDAALLSPGREVNSRMSGSSSSTDPDRQKLGEIKEDADQSNNIDDPRFGKYYE